MSSVDEIMADQLRNRPPNIYIQTDSSSVSNRVTLM